MKKIDISPLLIFALCLLAYCLPPGIFFPFLLAAGLHETAHIVLCKLLHVKIKAFSLSASGAELTADFKTYLQELLCISAGPAVNFLCVLLFFRFAYFALFSLLLGLYNSLPLSSLDGGRLLHILLLRLCSFSFAEKLCQITEAAVCLLLAVGGVILCCVYHAGLWSMIACGLLLAKSKGLENILLFLPRRRKIKKKSHEGAI
ncbi:MAG: hypothetical protein MJ085_03800 [Clostridia bacterium]|nr:hypothetical protein [Clostridia bacterium]